MRQTALALVLIAAACAQHPDPRIVLLGGGGQSVLTPPNSPMPDEHAAWADGVQPPRPQRDLWIRIKLPKQLPSEPHLVFRAYSARMEIFAGSQQLYRFDEPQARGYLRTHDVSLAPSAAGGWLVMRIPSGEDLLIGGEPVIAPAAAVPATIVAITTAPFRDDLLHDAVGTALMIIGLGCIAVSRLRVRGNAASLLWFGLFALLYGLRLITASGLPALLGFSLASAHYATSWITYVIPVPGWQMARALVGDGWKGSLRWQVAAFAMLAPIGILSDVIQHRPESLRLANSVLVVIGGLNLILNVIAAARTGQREAWILMTGTIFFLLYALARNLATLRLVPWSEPDETLGFVVFTSCLGYAAMRARQSPQQARRNGRPRRASSRHDRHSCWRTTPS